MKLSMTNNQAKLPSNSKTHKGSYRRVLYGYYSLFVYEHPLKGVSIIPYYIANWTLVVMDVMNLTILMSTTNLTIITWSNWMNLIELYKTCVECKELFLPKHKDTKFCSTSCNSKEMKKTRDYNLVLANFPL